MRCLVTGASGHLGSFLARDLVAHGHDVAVLVRPTSDLSRIDAVRHRLLVIHGQLATIQLAEPEIVAFAPETVFHLGWFGVTGAGRDAEEQVRHNVLGSLALFDVVRKAGCTTWVGVGSQAEYGPFAGVLDEDTPARPLTRYGVSKLCVGLLTRELSSAAGIRHIWLRLLATYGPGDDARHLIPSVILQLLAGERPALTSGRQRWDYLYVEDAAEAIRCVADRPSAEGVFVLGSGQALPVRDIVERIRDLIDPRLPLGFGEMPTHSTTDSGLEGDVSRLIRVTGWRPRISLEAGLAKTVAWYRADIALDVHHRGAADGAGASAPKGK